MNTIPGDPRSVMDPSESDLNLQAETTRGKKEKDMIAIVKEIDKVLKGK